MLTKRASWLSPLGKSRQPITKTGRELLSCPVNYGQPTTMLRETFKKICNLHQLVEKSHCADFCRGKLPTPGLTLIDRQDIQQIMGPVPQENAMIKRRNGKCDICGHIKNIEKVSDVETCSTCTFIVRAVKNTPELMIAELQRQHGEKYLGKPVVVGDQINDEDKRRANAAEQVIASLRALLDVPETTSLFEVIKQIDVDRMTVTAELKSSLENNERLLGDIRAMQERISAISDELNELREITVAAARTAGVEFSFSPGAFETPSLLRKVVNRYEEMGTPIESCLSETTGRDAALLDLAIGVLAGKINGIDASLISSLR